MMNLQKPSARFWRYLALTLLMVVYVVGGQYILLRMKSTFILNTAYRDLVRPYERTIKLIQSDAVERGAYMNTASEKKTAREMEIDGPEYQRAHWNDEGGTEAMLARFYIANTFWCIGLFLAIAVAAYPFVRRAHILGRKSVARRLLPLGAFFVCAVTGSVAMINFDMVSDAQRGISVSYRVVTAGLVSKLIEKDPSYEMKFDGVLLNSATVGTYQKAAQASLAAMRDPVTYRGLGWFGWYKDAIAIGGWLIALIVTSIFMLRAYSRVMK